VLDDFRRISSSHDSRHSLVTSKFCPKITRLLVLNLLQVTTVSCTIFILTVIIHVHTCFTITSNLTPSFAASVALCTDLWSWRIHTDSPKNQNGLHNFVPIQDTTFRRKTASIDVSKAERNTLSKFKKA